MANCLMLGFVLTIATIGVHAVGTAWWIGCLKRIARVPGKESKRFLPLRVLCATAVLLLSLHLIEVAIWAGAYRVLPLDRPFSTLEEATYFSTVTFASLGYGDIVITGPWRLLSAIQAMNGLLVFGWSTALLFAVVERIWSDQEKHADDSRANDSSGEDSVDDDASPDRRLAA
ncbi:MAG: potassium channel family protein [Planctomycetota bacterium]